MQGFSTYLYIFHSYYKKKKNVCPFLFILHKFWLIPEKTRFDEKRCYFPKYIFVFFALYGGMRVYRHTGLVFCTFCINLVFVKSGVFSPSPTRLAIERYLFDFYNILRYFPKLNVAEGFLFPFSREPIFCKKRSLYCALLAFLPGASAPLFFVILSKNSLHLFTIVLQIKKAVR